MERLTPPACPDCPLRSMPPARPDDWTRVIELVRFNLSYPEDPAIVAAMPNSRAMAEALAKDRPERCRQLAQNLPRAPRASKRGRPMALCPEVRAVDYAINLGLIDWPEG